MEFQHWEEHFRLNRHHFSDIDWNRHDYLSAKERKVICSSLRQFQRGEHSEGKHLFEFAKSFPDPAYLRSIVLFIKEEQTHARVLSLFMEKNRIPKLESHWVDNVFRWLRSLGSLRNSVQVLLTAEIIAKVYYQALAHATNSNLLQQLCRQIVKDELSHIEFQCSTLNIMNNATPEFSKKLNHFIHFVLMFGTTAIVWVYHRRVLSRGGFGIRRFFNAVFGEFWLVRKKIKSISQLVNEVTS